MSSSAQAAASRANSLASTGPRTDEGKAVSRLNALRHGATSKALILPGEDPAEYERATAALMKDLRPATEAETLQARRVADLWWRLQRLYKSATERPYWGITRPSLSMASVAWSQGAGACNAG